MIQALGEKVCEEEKLDPFHHNKAVKEKYGEILLSAKTPRKDGKGYAYPVMGQKQHGRRGSIPFTP